MRGLIQVIIVACVVLAADPVPDHCFSIINITPESASSKRSIGSYFISDLNFLLGRSFDHTMRLIKVQSCQRQVDQSQAMISQFQLELANDGGLLVLNSFGDTSQQGSVCTEWQLTPSTVSVVTIEATFSITLTALTIEMSDGTVIQLGQDNFGMKKKITLNHPQQQLVGFSARMSTTNQVESLSAVMYDCIEVPIQDDQTYLVRWQDMKKLEEDDQTSTDPSQNNGEDTPSTDQNENSGQGGSTTKADEKEPFVSPQNPGEDKEEPVDDETSYWTIIFIIWSMLLIILIVALGIIVYQRKKLAQVQQQQAADHNSFSFAERHNIKQNHGDNVESSLESCMQGPPLETQYNSAPAISSRQGSIPSSVTTAARISKFYRRNMRRAKIAHQPYASLQRAIDLNKRKSLETEKIEIVLEAETIVETTAQNAIETTFEDRIRVSNSAKGSTKGNDVLTANQLATKQQNIDSQGAQSYGSEYDDEESCESEKHGPGDGNDEEAASIDSQISFENIQQYNSEKVNPTKNNRNALNTNESVAASDEVHQTKEIIEIDNRHKRDGKHKQNMKSSDVKKQMNKAYLFMNSKVQRSSMGYSSRSTPTRNFNTPQFKSKSFAGETEFANSTPQGVPPAIIEQPDEKQSSAMTF